MGSVGYGGLSSIHCVNCRLLVSCLDGLYLLQIPLTLLWHSLVVMFHYLNSNVISRYNILLSHCCYKLCAICAALSLCNVHQFIMIFGGMGLVLFKFIHRDA